MIFATMDTHVKLLECPRYPEGAAFPCTPKTIEHPAWEQIETAIRRLNKHSHPFIFLAPVIDEEERINGDNEFFEVMGGCGDYWVAGSMNGYWQRRAINDSGTDDEIDLWTSDQGFAASGKFIIHDLNDAIMATKYYYERNDFWPKLKWEEQEPRQNAT